MNDLLVSFYSSGPAVASRLSQLKENARPFLEATRLKSSQQSLGEKTARADLRGRINRSAEPGRGQLENWNVTIKGHLTLHEPGRRVVPKKMPGRIWGDPASIEQLERRVEGVAHSRLPMG
jgi:hypothetical protein